MKKSGFAAILLVGLMTLMAVPVEASVTVGISFFHQTLAPYGHWVVSASYGSVWVPEVAVGWEPYVNGEWLYTDCGWSWVSYDPWGDIPFHYGTWVWISRQGWVWIPGLVWAPAWVTWAYTADYVGWAPVPPTFALSASGYFGQPIVVSQARYVFVPTQQFVGVRVSTVRVSTHQSEVIFPQATKVTSYRVSGGVVHNVGPAPERIERASGRRIERVPVSRARLQPTTLAQAGIAKSSRLEVVAPARERESAARAIPSARPESGKAPIEREPERSKHAAVAQRQAPSSSRTDSRGRPENPPASVQAQSTHPKAAPRATQPHEEQAMKHAPRTSMPEHAKPIEPKKQQTAATTATEQAVKRPQTPNSHIEKQVQPERQAALHAPQRPPAEAKRERPAPHRTPHHSEKNDKANE
ncbi:MAG TPA: DUF6600 domain-containing protein [Thermoanaerobaculia bacterium]|nr:DUF6600 domain-containing protein [Thermoanaerobaculia bacterium]